VSLYSAECSDTICKVAKKIIKKDMTKMTRTAFNRKFYQTENGVMRRDTALPVAPKGTKGCKVCRLPISYTMGQVVNTHKECREDRNKVEAIIKR